MRSQTIQPFTGRHMLMIMLAFFAIVFAANMSLVYFANHSWTGLVVKNSYVASQEFNETTTRMEQAAADVHADLKYQNGQMSVTLTDNDGNAVNGTNVNVTLGRPSHEGEDQTITLQAQGNGVHTANHGLSRGQWSGTVAADVPGHQAWARPVHLLVKE
jgi:nitrogen fixation protein FixH